MVVEEEEEEEDEEEEAGFDIKSNNPNLKGAEKTQFSKSWEIFRNPKKS